MAKPGGLRTPICTHSLLWKFLFFNPLSTPVPAMTPLVTYCRYRPSCCYVCRWSTIIQSWDQNCTKYEAAQSSLRSPFASKNLCNGYYTGFMSQFHSRFSTVYFVFVFGITLNMCDIWYDSLEQICSTDWDLQRWYGPFPILGCNSVICRFMVYDISSILSKA